MGTITQKQVDAINAKCGNGFHFDVRNYLEKREKVLCKYVALVEGKTLARFELYWNDEIVTRKNEHGCNVREYTGNVVPVMHCSIWNKSTTSECWVSHGLGKFHTFDKNPSPKRLMNILCAKSGELSEDFLRSMLPEEYRKLFTISKVEL